MIKKILSLLIIIFLTATNAFAVVSGLYLDTSLNKIDAERNAHIHNNTGLMYMQEGFYYGAIKELDYIDAQKVVLRDRPDKDRLSELANDRLAFFHDYEDLVMMYIKQLKASSNPEYRELADYYIACMQFVGFVDNDFDFETNQIIAIHYLMQLHKLDNRYAIGFLSIFTEDIANSDI